HRRFEQLAVLRVPQPQLSQPLGLSLTHIAGRGLRVRVGVLVVPTEGLPMLVAGALYGFPDVVSGERHAAKLSHWKLDVQMVACAPVAQCREAHAPEIHTYQGILEPAPAGGAEVGRVRVTVALDVMQRSVVRAEAHRRVVPWPASEIGDHQLSVDQDEGRQRDAQERMK